MPHMQCFLFIGHGLYPRIACFSLVSAYTNALIAFHWSRATPTHDLFSGNHSVDFIYSQMYLSKTSARFIAGEGDILQKNIFLKFISDKRNFGMR